MFLPMSRRFTMVKKVLASGEPCKKCLQAEEMLRTRGLWERIDRVVFAEESNPESEGMRLSAEHQIELAPFFIVESTGQPAQVYTSAIKFVKEQFTEAAAVGSGAAPSATGFGAIVAKTSESDPKQTIRAALEAYGAACAISFSGAEDVVLIDMAVKLGLPFSVFSLDTGRLHAETYRFIDAVRKHYGIEIQLFSPDPGLLQPFVQKKGLFSFYDDGHGECCGVRKVEPLRRALSGYRAWITGQRKDQSVTRTDLPIAQEHGGFQGSDGPVVKFNPLANWTSAQTWEYLRDHEVPYNSLHDNGFISIGCEPCTRPVRPAEHERAGRWWWEAETQRECGLHKRPVGATEPGR